MEINEVRGHNLAWSWMEKMPGWCVGKVRVRRIRSNVLLLLWLLLEEDREALPPLQLAAALPQASRGPWGEGGFVLLLNTYKQQRELLLPSVIPANS